MEWFIIRAVRLYEGEWTKAAQEKASCEMKRFVRRLSESNKISRAQDWTGSNLGGNKSINREVRATAADG
jgi:hypothetical protein